MLGDLEKNLEQYRELLEKKEKQLEEAKRILVTTKQSFDKVSQENRDIKTYIEQIKGQFQQENQWQQLDFIKQQKSFYNNPRPKKSKKVVLEEESDANFETEEIEEELQVKKLKIKNKKSQQR